MSTPRVRIAPSPTGNLHVGTARTALFNYLFAKHDKDNIGTFILRIEDTDQERSRPEFEKNILDGLRWLGLNWDEELYRQSERRVEGIYKKYLLELLENDKVFACYHGKEDMHYCSDRDRKYDSADSRPFVIRYKNFAFPEYAEHLYQMFKDTKENPREVIDGKFYIGRGADWQVKYWVSFVDEIRGRIDTPMEILGDFVIAKSIEEPLYNFVVIIDDYEMKITDVIRGEDHIPNTPKQLLIAHALGWALISDELYRPLWRYAHIPLILGTDRSKLSKRHGAMSVLEYRKLGYLPEALFNFLALLGWHPKDDQEIFSKEELIAEFSLEKVQKSGAIFDFQKLDWMNGEYIRKKPLLELVPLCVPFIADFLSPYGGSPEGRQFPLPNSQFSMDYIERVVALEQPRLKKLSEIGERVDYFFRQPVYTKELLKWKTMSDAEILDSFTHSERILAKLDSRSSKEAIEKAFLDEIGERDKGPFLWPLRVALSGKKASPGPFEIMAVLGIKESLNRIKSAQELMRV